MSGPHHLAPAHSYCGFPLLSLFTYFHKPRRCLYPKPVNNKLLKTTAMNTPSEKRPYTPLLPTTKPTMPTNLRDNRSLPERLHALMNAITRFVDTFRRMFESLALALMVAIQIICLGTVLAQTVALAYLFSMERKTM